MAFFDKEIFRGGVSRIDVEYISVGLYGSPEWKGL